MTTPRRLRRPQPRTTRLATIAQAYGVPLRMALTTTEYQIRRQAFIASAPNGPRRTDTELRAHQLAWDRPPR